MPETSVRAATRADTAPLSQSLARAFYTDPVFSHFLPDDSTRLKKLESVPWSARVADFDAPTKEVVLNAGSDVGVAVGDVFEVHRVARVIKDPDTGEIIGTRTTLVGKIKVTQVEKKIAMASVVEGTEFAVGDIVREPKG